jgi:N-acetylglucosaminyl-diphospho-decaprenol L-rhamnosyltransferase
VSNTFEVLVVSYASDRVIERLLASLVTTLPDAPVAIREHAADAANLAALERLGARHTAPVRVEHDPSNPGFGAGCNALARTSSADFLVFLNPDTQLLAWPWSNTTRPPAGTVIGPVMVDSGPASEHYGRTYRIRDEIARSWLRRRPSPPDGNGYVSGAAMLIERAAFQRLGGFDPRFFMFYEDIDLCLRANEAGYPTIIEPNWSVRHDRRHSTDERFGQALTWSYESAARFHSKHGSPVRGYRAYVTADSTLRAVRCVASRDPLHARNYWHLARRAARDALTKGGSGP